MVEDNRLGSDGVNAKTALTAISKYAYDKKTLTGEDYALMMVMTEYVFYIRFTSGHMLMTLAIMLGH